MNRDWHETHIQAGYHEQKWGVTPTPDSQLVGTYNDSDGRSIVVRYLAAGPTAGPEFEIEWQSGAKVTVLDEETAIQYLVDAGAAEYIEGEED